MSYCESFRASYARCNIDEDFLTFFLKHFCSTNPRFSERFCGVDNEKQTRMLKASIILVQNASDNPYIRNNVKSLAKRHKDMNLNIKPEELVAWRESLLVTVANFDPLFDDEIEQAWRSTLELGIEIMSKHAIN
ncbi:globin domain-containing protein [Vibrio astriarenae]|uniref:globin domain-containing protein n=1 Tax=Vibrio agarivorans TaxID=153622 RepID=UPI0035A226A7